VTFKDANLDLQHLVRELHLLRQHNLQFKEGDPQHTLMLFAEAALVLIVLERFVRAVVGDDVTNGDTLHSLLEKATSQRRGPLLVLPWDDQQEGIRRVCGFRNSLLHANYQQAATNAGCSSAAEYFKVYLAADIEVMFKVVGELLRQIDPETGRRRTGCSTTP